MLITNVRTEKHLDILLAEDDVNDVLLLRRALQRLQASAQLFTVSCGEEVIAYLEGDSRFADRQSYPVPRVVFLDQFMPRWSGLDILLWIRSSPRFEHLPVVILSLGLSPAQAEAAQMLKAACCPKTPQLDQLPIAIDQAFGLVASLGVRSAFGVGVTAPVEGVAREQPAARRGLS